MSQRTFRLITIAGAALCILSFAGGIVRVVSINRETAGIVQQAEEWERKTGGVYQEIEEAGSHQVHRAGGQGGAGPGEAWRDSIHSGPARFKRLPTGCSQAWSHA